jgi:hypothetical protein
MIAVIWGVHSEAASLRRGNWEVRRTEVLRKEPSAPFFISFLCDFAFIELFVQLAQFSI